MTTFDGFYHLKKVLGVGILFNSTVSFYNALDANSSSSYRFASVPGPANLAICTTSTSKISLPGITSCMLTKTCNTGFAVALWVQPPPKHFLPDKDIVILDTGAFKLLYGSPLCNDTIFPSYKFQVENGSQLCTWTLLKNCTSSQAWTQLLFSFDIVNGRAFVLVNGLMEILQKTNCTTVTPQPAISTTVGSAMHICIDNLVLWDTPLNTSFAMKTFCAFSHCGEYLVK